VKRLAGQIAIVTGGGTGIGRATALVLADEGAHVVLAGRRRPPLDAVAAEVERAGGQASARTADLADPDEAAGLGRWTAERFGRVDVVIHNAGHSSRVRNVRWVSRAEWDSVIGVNLDGVFALTQAVLPSMIERGGGTIVTVSSAAALRPGFLSGAPYGAAKAAVRNLMAFVHTTLRGHGIRATTIMPAEVDTPILC
jgi:NAD(P)-dependent dehydrogenase (short-subunit alcohol dehydrogenase family)